MNYIPKRAVRSEPYEGQSLGNDFKDISRQFRPDSTDSKIIRRIVKCEGSPRAIKMFVDEHRKLTDYAYWFVLGTLWVNYAGLSDLQTWKWLFSSKRPGRDESLMKPSEICAYADLPKTIPALRVHRPGEEDWISYTLLPSVARRFAAKRGVDEVSVYAIDFNDALCVFTRRKEAELIVLDRTKATLVRTYKIEPIDPAA